MADTIEFPIAHMSAHSLSLYRYAVCGDITHMSQDLIYMYVCVK